jgi:signal transduction histidine kinase
VGVVLLMLAIVQGVVNARARRLQRQITDITYPARVTVNDAQVALAKEMFATGEVLQGARAAGIADYRRSLSDELRAEYALDSLVPRLGGAFVDRFSAFRALSAHWHETVIPLLDSAPGRAPAPVALRESLAEPSANEAMVAAAELDSLLEASAVSERERIRSAERLDVFLPGALAPLAFLSVLIVAWTGRRIMVLATAAHADRRTLARTVAEKEGLLRGVTHDVKNPLGAAAGYTELLTDGVLGPLSADQLNVVSRVHKLVHVALRTLNDLLELFRAGGGQLLVQRAETALAPIVRECAADHAATASAMGLTIATDLPAEEVLAYTDPTRVRQILDNLISNAIKYTPSGGHIMVRVKRHGGRPAIEVQDSGPGIPEEYRERVFEEFYRLPTTPHDMAGAGVGLAISRRIARLLGGDLSVWNAAEGGAVFGLSVPPVS